MFFRTKMIGANCKFWLVEKNLLLLISTNNRAKHFFHLYLFARESSQHRYAIDSPIGVNHHF